MNMVKVLGSLCLVTFCELTGANVRKIKTEEMYARGNTSCRFFIFGNHIAIQSLCAARTLCSEIL